MSIRKELDNLTTSDIYSLMLFVLYKSTEIPEYSSLSQLAYILDKDSLLKLCEFYGGLTIKIPTIDQLENLMQGLLMFQLVDLDKEDFETVVDRFDKKTVETYNHIKEILKNYSFNSGRTSDGF
jgi:hypothetical protein